MENVLTLEVLDEALKSYPQMTSRFVFVSPVAFDNSRDCLDLTDEEMAKYGIVRTAYLR